MNLNAGLPPLVLSNGRLIGPDEPCFIVAEIGQCHQGDTYTAIRLIKAAHDAGVDAVKFQKRDIDSDLTREAQNQPYNGPQSFGATYGEHRRALELSPDEYRHIKERMRYNQWPEIMFVTACDCKSVDDLEDSIQPLLYKVASRDLDNLPLLRYIARLGKPVILSTGMARSRAEIEEAILALQPCRVVLLVCTSEYPTPPQHVGLCRLSEYRERFNALVGMSDHTSGIVAAQAAATLGACVVEKHITLSRAMKGTDHAASLEPDGIARLVRNIRLVEAMRPWNLTGRDRTEIEATRRKLGRSLVSASDLPAGHVISHEDLTLKSPGTGLSYADAHRLIGKATRQMIPANVTLDHSDVLQPQEDHCGVA